MSPCVEYVEHNNITISYYDGGLLTEDCIDSKCFENVQCNNNKNNMPIHTLLHYSTTEASLAIGNHHKNKLNTPL